MSDNGQTDAPDNVVPLSTTEEKIGEQAVILVKDLNVIADRLKELSRNMMGHFLALESATQEAAQICVDLANAFEFASQTNDNDEGNDNE